MDQKRFDQLTVTLARGAHRRTLLQLLSGALIGAGLLATPEAAGKGKGKGRGKSKAAKRRKQQREKRDKRDKATAEACPLCKRLNNQGRCVVDHAVHGQCCTRAGGQSGQCLNGTCWPGPCSGPICTEQTCPDGCCDAAAQCHVDDADACGTGGESCAPCDVAGEVCQDGACVCESGVICSASGCCPNAADVCDADDECCSKTSCAAQNANCGQIPDGCDGVIDCGTCTIPNTCGGGNPGTPNRCGCTNSTCPAGANCGTITNPCGAAVSCGGDCPQPGQPCVNNVCGTCVPDCAGKPCGLTNDDCGGPCLAGSCPSGQTCGGGDPGTPGVCGCTPNCTGKCNGENDGCGGTCACPTGQDCVNGACLAGQGTCPTGADFCTSDATICNDNCICAVSTEGDTICASIVAPPGDNLCGICQTSQDCVEAFPTVPGVFCLRTNAAGSTCCTDSPGLSGLCALRCATP